MESSVSEDQQDFYPVDPAPQVIFEAVRLTPTKKRKVRLQLTYFTKLNFSLKLDTSIVCSAMRLKCENFRCLLEGSYIRPGKLDTRFFLLRQGQEGERKVPGIKAGGIQVVHLNTTYLNM